MDNNELVGRGDLVATGELPFGSADVHNGVRQRRGETFRQAEYAAAGGGDAVRDRPSMGREDGRDAGGTRRDAAQDTGFSGVSRDQVRLATLAGAFQLTTGS